MKRIIFSALTLLFIASCTGGSDAENSEAKVEFANNNDKISYAMGVSIGKDIAMMLKMQGHDSILNKDLLVRGLGDAIKGLQLSLHQDSCQSIVGEYLTSRAAKQREASLTQFEGVKREGEAFLEENKKRKEVTTTMSGLQYEILKKGSGPMAQLGDSVEVHYRGTLLNGKEFDSSYGRNETFKFEVSFGGLIEGWIEGIQLMNKGSKFKFWLPYQLAYGERGAGEDIVPYSALVFEIELINITPRSK
ncbi:MAG: FKBP-type peptidyl-prolyl cis-trans isomerase [Flavobacteriales bacterium]|nr:FKBP-type peptidyl-prolyl cis-trans isomerase [Flavobacteriales bacterium]